MGDRPAGDASYLVVHKELGQHEEEAEGVHPWETRYSWRACTDHGTLTAPELGLTSCGFLAGRVTSESNILLLSSTTSLAHRSQVSAGGSEDRLPTHTVPSQGYGQV